jgi:hypothetical protein
VSCRRKKKGGERREERESNNLLFNNSKGFNSVSLCIGKHCRNPREEVKFRASIVRAFL